MNVHAAWPPDRAIPAHDGGRATGLPPAAAVNVTVPPLGSGLTVAVAAAVPPASTGELMLTVVLVVALVTANAILPAEARSVALPEYLARNRYFATWAGTNVQDAWPATRGTAAQLAGKLTLTRPTAALKVTDPVAVSGLTVAVTVTAWPNCGLADAAIVVVVAAFRTAAAAGPAPDTTRPATAVATAMPAITPLRPRLRMYALTATLLPIMQRTIMQVH